MSLNMSNMHSGGSGSDLGQAREGGHLGCLIGLVDLGVQNAGEWNGKPKPPCQQLCLIFELLDDTVEIDGVVQNRIYSTKVWAKSGDKAKLTKIYGTLDPTGQHQGDLTRLLPTYTNISLKAEVADTGPRKGETFIRFDSLMQPLQGQQFPQHTKELILLDQSADIESQKAALRQLQPWVIETIRAGLNFQGSTTQAALAALEAEAQAVPQPQTQAPVVGATPAPVTSPQPTPAIPQIPGAPAFPGAPTIAPAQAQTPVVSPAPVTAPNLPPAPPGYRYDQATNSYVLV